MRSKNGVFIDMNSSEMNATLESGGVQGEHQLINDLAAFSTLGFLALTCIWFGALRSVRHYHKQKESGTESVDVVSTRDAALFPLIASGSLVTVYLMFVVLSKEYIILVASIYFFGIGSISIYNLIKPIIAYVPESLAYRTYEFCFKEILNNGEPGDTFEFMFDCRDVALMVLSAMVSGVYAKTKHWIANNVIGIALSITSIQVVQLNTFKNAVLLLFGLFVYDIFWVFGTNVMVSVAKNLEAPIKLIAPQQIFTSNAFSLHPKNVR
ncbi:hypothetical protein ACOME3_009821 [Neoechinorhynchus agilis]